MRTCNFLRSSGMRFSVFVIYNFLIIFRVFFLSLLFIPRSDRLKRTVYECALNRTLRFPLFFLWGGDYFLDLKKNLRRG